MFNSLLVGIGGFLGSIARYLVGILVYKLMAYPTFPYSTLIVNISGCFIIGLLSGLAETRSLLSP